MLGVVDHLPDNVDFLIGNDLDAGSRIESVNVVVRLQAKKLLRVDQIDDVTGDVKKDIELSLIRVMKLQICDEVGDFDDSLPLSHLFSYNVVPEGWDVVDTGESATVDDEVELSYEIV